MNVDDEDEKRVMRPLLWVKVGRYITVPKLVSRA